MPLVVWREHPREAELEVCVHVCSQFGPWAVLRVRKDALHGGLPQVEVTVGHGGLLAAAKGGVSEVRVQVLSGK